MNRRLIIWYGLLVLVPTAIIGAAGVRLLRHEQERLQIRTDAAYALQARAVADTLLATLTAFEDELTARLREAPADALLPNLLALEQRHPLVRAVFIWDPRQGLLYPTRDGATAEERRMLSRYAPLFSGQMAWGEPPAEHTPVPAATPTGSARKTPAGAAGFGAGSSSVEYGWIPWYSENQLHPLGWRRHGTNGPVYGVELEFAAALSRLLAAMPSPPVPGMAYVLRDGDGRVVHQTGAAPDAARLPAAGVSLAPSLPHWTVAVFPEAAAGSGNGRTLMLFGGALLAILAATIAFGGGLLVWQAQRRAREAAQKTTFVSNVSHELKTPLTSIRMYAELLSEGRVSDPEKRRHYLDVLVTESQRLTRLVNNVLDFSRLEQSRKRYRIERLDASAVLRKFAAAHTPRAAAAGMDLRVESDVTCPVMADRDALEQMLLNLLDNALKYAAPGKELRWAARNAGPWVELRVADRGPGVPPSERERIFETFYRLDDTLTTRQPGCGLGLSIGRRLARDLGGDLWCEARDGGGSCFVLRLPAAQSEPPLAPRGRQ